MSTGQVYAPTLPSPQPTPIAQSASTTAATDHTVGTIVGVIFGVIGFILVLCLFTCCCGMCRVRGATLESEDVEKGSNGSTVSTLDRSKWHDHDGRLGINHRLPIYERPPQVVTLDEVENVRKTVPNRHNGLPPRWPPGGIPPAPLRPGRRWGGPGGGPGGGGYGYRPRGGGPSPRPPRPPPPATLPADTYAVHHRRSGSSSPSESLSRGTSPTVPTSPSPPPPDSPPSVTPPPRSPRIPPPPPPVRIIRPQQQHGRDCISRKAFTRVIDKVIDRQGKNLDDVHEQVIVEREQRRRDTQRLVQRNGQLADDVAEMRESMVDLNERVGDLGDQAAGLQHDLARLEHRQQMQGHAAQIAAARPQPPVVVNNNLCGHRPQSRGPVDSGPPEDWPGPPGPRNNGPQGPVPGQLGVYLDPSFHTAPEYPDSGGLHWPPSSNTDLPRFSGDRPGGPPLPSDSRFGNSSYGTAFAPELSEGSTDADPDRLSMYTASEQPSPRTNIRRPSIEFHPVADESADPGPARPNRGPRNSGRPGRFQVGSMPPDGRFWPPGGSAPAFRPMDREVPSREGFPSRPSREDLRDRGRQPTHAFAPSEADIRRRHSMDRSIPVHQPNDYQDERDRRPRRGSMDIPGPELRFEPQHPHGSRPPFVDRHHVRFARPERQFSPPPPPANPRRNSIGGGLPAPTVASSNMHSNESDISSFDNTYPPRGRQPYDPERVRGTSRRTSSTVAWSPSSQTARDGERSRHLQNMRRTRTRMEDMETIQSQGSYSEDAGSGGPDQATGSTRVRQDGRMQYNRFS
ncbi:hypothetical protein TWF696_005728 [Orbilia brochopaga]|uniref:Uncharacterized protein n=1 Tax=Orbilia brochopaga TaxID=3140254 RepID=A0AAV9UWH0_9PEZI